jgi:hypothetical protein
VSYAEVDTFEGRPFSDDPLLGTVERVWSGYPPDARPSKLWVNAATFQHFRSLPQPDPPPFGPPAPTPLGQLDVTVDTSLYDTCVMGDGKTTANDRWITLDDLKVHSLRYCAGADDMTGCHDMSVYTGCGHENCSGQDEYVEICKCICHDG